MARAELTPQEKELKKVISATLNKLLSAKGVRKIDVVNGTGINNSTIYDYFNGKFLPTQNNVVKLANYFHVEPEEIDPRLTPTSAMPMSHSDLFGRQQYFKQDTNLEQINAALDCLKSFNGEPLTEHDRKVLSGLILSYLENR